MPRETNVRLRIRVIGRVQGVGFRFFSMQSAQEHGVRGWVKNCPDGSVEMEAEGEDSVVKEFIARIEKGNSWARVERTDSFPVTPLNDPLEDFSIC